MGKGNQIVEYVQTNRVQIVKDWSEKLTLIDKQRVSKVISEKVYINICNNYLNLIINSSTHHAQVVLIDITGVPVVDTIGGHIKGGIIYGC